MPLLRPASLLASIKGIQVGHGLLHHARGFHHLRQEHLALAEQVADHVHAGHQRAFDHLDRTRCSLARFLGVLLDKLGDAFHQRIFQALLHVPAAPFGLLNVVLLTLAFVAAVFLRQRQQALGGIVAAVEDHVLDRVAQLGRQVVVNRQLAGVDDAHVHAVADGVVEEHGVDRLAHRVVAAERERHVGHAAGDQRMRQLRV